jgi:type I restriction enzyme S subunit
MEKLLPKLRFPVFIENWNYSTLGDIGQVSMCKRVLKEQTSVNSEIPFYKIGTFGKEPDAFISRELFDALKNKYSYPKMGDILISASGTIGRTAVFDGRPSYFQDSNIVWIDNSEKTVLNKFLFYLYKNTKWNTENTTIARLYNSNLRGIEITYPNINEQNKIADFLLSIDSKINQLSKKKELLEQYKKGIMQKIFNQEIRFKDINGKDYPKWTEAKLSDFKNLIHGDGDWILSKDLSKDGKHKLIQLGNIGYGIYKEKDLKTISAEKFIELKGTPIKKGDLLINRMVDSNLYCCILDKDGDYITSVDVCWIRENDTLNNYFLMSVLLFEKNQNKLLNLSSGSGRVRISKYNLFNEFYFLLPSFEEQAKIANFLSAIDNKINQVVIQLEKTNEFKNGLLQQMFV